MEQDALFQITDQEVAAAEPETPEAKEAYKFFMRMEPVKRDEPGVIHVEEETGKRYEMRAVGMVRNAKNPRTLKVYLDPAPHVIVDDMKPLEGWYKDKHVPAGVRARPCFTDSVLTQPYGGSCPVRCSFCYVDSGTRGYRAQSLTTVPLNYGAQVSKALSRMRTSAAAYISSFTEPFQELENYYHNSQGCAEAFDRAGLPVYFLTRMCYPGWAIDLLKRNKYSYAQKSINCLDPKTWHKISPNCPPMHQQLDDVRALHKAGIYVSIQVNPIMPGIVSNDEIVELIHALSDAGADHLIFKFTEIGYSSKKAMVDIAKKQFGPRGQAYADLMTCNIGHQATIDETYRLDALRLYYNECKKAGVTSATCYEYKFERDDKGRVLNTTGISVGRDFLTAEQCHGHRVPMFHRLDAETLFREIEDCPPTGCLYCADDNAGKPRCGDEDLGKAKSRTYQDMKHPLVQIGGVQ